MSSDPLHQPVRPHERFTGILICAGFIAATFLAYWPVGQNDFLICDDPLYVTFNPYVQHGLTSHGFRWAFTTFTASNWHPLTWLSHMLDCQLWGMNAARHHHTNVLIHAASSAILFLALRRMTASIWPSAFVAGVFALHPLHVESVAWASERKDVLSGFFFVLALYVYSSYARRARARSYFALVLTFALGLLTKPTLVTLPFVLLLLDYWPLRRRRSMRFLVLEKLPLFVLAIGSSIVTFIAQRQGGSVSGLNTLPVGVRISNALVSYLRYIGKAFWPSDLAALYPFNNGPLTASAVSAAILLLACITFACFRARKTQPFLIVGWLWFLGMLVPAIGLVQVGLQAMADRYMYLPLIGLSIMVAWSAAQIEAIGACRVAGAVGIGVLTACAVLTWRQVEFWKDGVTLWEHSLAVTPDNPFSRNSLGVELAARHRIDEALDHFRRAIAIAPDYPPAYVCMGRTLIVLGRYNEADRALRKAYELNPREPDIPLDLGDLAAARGQHREAAEHYRRSLQLNPAQPLVEYNLSMALIKLGDARSAEQHLRQAIWLKPNDPAARYHLATLLIRTGANGEAERQLRESLRLEPEAPQVHYDLGMLLLRAGQTRQAIAELRDATKIDDRFLPAAQNLAWILATHPSEQIRDPIEALRLARHSDELAKHQVAAVLDTLAAAYAANHQFPQAMEYAQTALSLAKSSGKDPLAKEIEQRLTLYHDGKAFLDKSLTP